MAVVSEIYSYTLKSGRGQSLELAEVQLPGIVNDRRFMVVSADTGDFITQRRPGMQALALVRAAVEGNRLHLSVPGMQEFLMPLDREPRRQMMVTFHGGQQLPAIDCGDRAAKWISSFLPRFQKQTLRIVEFPQDFQRSNRGRYTDSANALSQYADGYAALVFSEESVAQVNQWLAERGEDAVDKSAFRGNIILDGLGAFAEDRIKAFRVGDVEFETVKPCGRCMMTGVVQNQGTIQKNPKEPRGVLETNHAGAHLKELFPNLEEELLNVPMFGQNAIVRKPGVIHRGDTVEVIEQRGAAAR